MHYGADMKIDISTARKIKGWMKPEQLRWLARHATYCKRIVEVGSYRGRSTRAMLDSSQALMWCVDAWDYKGRGGTVGERDYAQFWKNIADVRDRVTIMSFDSATAARMLLDLCGLGTFDMVFIDGGHDYATVKGDIEGYRPLVKRGGLLCGDDYHPNWRGVVRAVDELVPDRKVDHEIWWKVID